jgi:hypothetical protein
MIKKVLFAVIAAITIFSSAIADEGMWLPIHIKRLNEADMQKAGLKLTAEEIYNINNSSLKDAIVSLGGFCTAEVISKEGLLLTNHHCGFGQIQSHSSVQNDYLSNGFWAKTKKDELPNKGLFVRFLVRMEEVTSKILTPEVLKLSGKEKNAKIEELKKQLVKEASEGTTYDVNIRDFFAGNEYYLFVYEVYKDIRLVGAPPSSIGKFGGDTDNWMWPRHTGDFAIFRIYMSPDGKPADYSEKNIPFKPKHHLPINISGVDNNDYAMVFGYPGRTQRYLTSHGIKLALEETNPSVVKIRDKKLALMKEDMDVDASVRIKYASKYAQISNYWKYFKGQSAGLVRLKTYDLKVAEENKYNQWANVDSKRKEKYGAVLSSLEKEYNELSKYAKAQTYIREALFGPEIITMAFQMNALATQMKASPDKKDEHKAAAQKLIPTYRGIYKNYNVGTDKKLMAAMFSMYNSDVKPEFHPEIFAEINKKYKGDFQKYADDIFKTSIFADSVKLMAFLNNPTIKVLDKEPTINIASSALGIAMKLNSNTTSPTENINNLSMAFIAGLMEMNPDKKFYPDANSTMRLTYGKVIDYSPADAVQYNYYTTMKGIIEKMDNSNPEFEVPAKLVDLYNKKDYGQYADKNGDLRVCFITDNDITGGNSGSPVIDAKGQLIGLAFDGNWEAMTGDLVYDPEFKRCINNDIRYVLFIIDKFAGAKHLIDEMTLVKENNDAKAELNENTKKAMEVGSATNTVTPEETAKPAKNAPATKTIKVGKVSRKVDLEPKKVDKTQAF